MVGWGLFVAALLSWSTSAIAAPHPEILRLLDLAEYSEAEDRARELYESAPAGSEDEALGCELFLRAARLSGRAPIRALLDFAHQVLVEREEAYGRDDLRVARILHELGNLQLQADDPAGAAQTHARALAIRESAQEGLGFEVAVSAQALANAELRLGRLEVARRLYLRALRGCAHARPDEPFRAAFALNGLGLIAQREGQMEQARQLFDRALAASYDPRVEDHPRTATIARNLGRLLLDQGEPGAALEVLRRSYRIRSRRLDAMSVHRSNAAFDLARAESALGDLASARRHVEEALNIREAKLGPDHAATRAARELRVELSTRLGDFSTAEADLDRLEAPAGQSLEVGPRDRLDFLRANLWNEQGDYDQAQRAYQELLAARRQRWGSESAEVAATLHNLAEVQRQLGDLAAALRSRRRAVEIQEKVLDPEDPDLGRGLVNLADLLLEGGQAAEARELAEHADRIFLGSLGAEHPVRAKALYLLSECDGLEGRPSVAVERCRQALALQLASYGEQHAEVAWGRERLARAEILAGQGRAGLQDALAAARLEQRQLRWVLQGLAERSALRFAAASMGAADLAMAALVTGSFPDSDELSRAVYERVVAGRSLVLEGMLARQAEAVRVGSEQGDRWRRVREARDRLAAAISNQSLRAAQLDSLRLRRDRAEAAWARSLKSAPVQGDPLTFRRLQQSLNPGAGLLSFSVYDADPRARSTALHYFGFFSRAGGELRALDLGPAAEIDGLLRRWRAAVLRAPDRGSRTSERTDTRALGARLRERLLDPFGEELRSVEELNLVLEGALHGLSFAALPLPSGEYWVEAGPRLRLLDHERQLLETRSPATESQPGHALVVGDIDFGAGPEASAAPSSRFCEELQTLRFAPLPATAGEVEDVAGFFSDVEVLRGREATEAALRDRAPAARVIHLASHGFFLGDRCGSSNRPRSRDVRGIGGLVPRSGQPRPLFQRSPLLRAGLVFAHANLRRAETPAEDDGILLAQEVLGLRLKPHAWVVLSACDTGVGESQAGEGVLGLRRAFAVAGAGTVVMSLWAVQDQSAREWMRELYRAKWSEGRPTAEAIAVASRRILARRRARGQSDAPFWWAGFVATGRD